MAAVIRLITSELISQVRSQLDESNEAHLDDITDILPALNRAQDTAANLLARHYESPLLAYQSVSLTTDQPEYDIPEDAFEGRLEKVEVLINTQYYPLKRVDHRDISEFDRSAGSTSIPHAYCIIGNQYRLLPRPTAAYSLRIWYLKDPEPLVMEQGKVISFDSGTRKITVDAIGDDISATGIEDLSAFVNIINGRTGEVRASLQVQNVNGNIITFKASPDRASVLGKTISNALPSTLAKDDYLTLVHGTCIPVLKKPFSNYIIQYAVAELQRKLGGPADMEQAITEKLEKVVEKSWVGREVSLRVQQVNKHWAQSRRRWYRD